MLPNSTSTVKHSGVPYDNDKEIINNELTDHKTTDHKIQIIWQNVIGLVFGYGGAVYGIWLAVTSASVYTNLFAFFLYVIQVFGITAGVHRLWTHRSYKAKTPLKILLIIFNTIAFQDCVIHWSRDHRVHHKYTETDADPHNRKRGFFFAHIGWLMCHKHPDVLSKGRTVDISDLESDPILRFQRKYYLPLGLAACFILPTLIPMYGWNESFQNAFYIAAIFRWMAGVNVAGAVNSVAHQWGAHPYDETINPAEAPTISFFTFGEAYHNYHHVFPWDYKTAELGFHRLNVTTKFIDFFATIGWAYELKSVSSDVIEKRVKRTGDGTHPTWGWGDKDQDDVEIKQALITHRIND